MEHKFILILGDKKTSSWSLRAWLVLKHTGVPFNEEIIKLGTPNTKLEILKYSPSGKVPVLQHGETLIWESLSIAEYLNELFPESKLWPMEEEARAFARSVSSEMHAGFTNLRKLMPFALNEPKKMPISTELDQEITRIEEIWQECRLKYAKSGDYLFNDFSIADAMFAPVVLRFKAYNYKPKNPLVARYCETILENSLIKEWILNS